MPYPLGGLHPYRFGDLIDALVRGFQAPLRGEQSLMCQPLMRSCARLLTESAREVAWGHGRFSGEIVDRKGFRQMLLCPFQHRRQPALFFLSKASIDEDFPNIPLTP